MADFDFSCVVPVTDVRFASDSRMRGVLFDWLRGRGSE